MARRSTVCRVEELILLDVLYEDGTRTSNRKVPGVDIDADLLAETYIEAQDRQIAEKIPGAGQVLDPRASPLRPAGAPHYVHQEG